MTNKILTLLGLKKKIYAVKNGVSESSVSDEQAGTVTVSIDKKDSQCISKGEADKCTSDGVTISGPSDYRDKQLTPTVNVTADEKEIEFNVDFSKLYFSNGGLMGGDCTGTILLGSDYKEDVFPKNVMIEVTDESDNLIIAQNWKRGTNPIEFVSGIPHTVNSYNEKQTLQFNFTPWLDSSNENFTGSTEKFVFNHVQAYSEDTVLLVFNAKPIDNE